MIDSLLIEANERRASGDTDGALAACKRAIAAAPNDPRGYSRYAHLALETFEYAGARYGFGNAVRLAPHDIGYLNNYGMTLVYIGDFDAAREHFRRAIALDPNCAASYYNLAPIALRSEAAALIDALEGIKTAASGELDLSLTGFALGKLYDDLGDWDRAFENFATANQKKAAAYNHKATLTFFEASKLAFSEVARPSGGSRIEHRQTPIFIVGMPRSGSSLAEEFLTQREGVIGLGERPEIQTLAAMLARRHSSGLGYPGCAPRLIDGELDELAELYLDSVNRQAKGASLIVDKQLLNFQYTPLLAMIFPSAPIVHCLRNPMDTCLSAYFTNFQAGQSYSFSLEDLGAYYRAYRDYMAHWQNRLPAAPIGLQYEELVRDRDAVMAGLEEQLGLPQSPNLAAPSKAPRDIRTSSAWQVRQPVYAHAVARWKNYEKHLGPLIDALGDLAQR